MLTRFKRQVQTLLTREAEILHQFGLTPNKISGIAILFGLLAGVLYWSSQNNKILLIPASILYLISGFFDALDGVVARLYGETTDFGGYLDSLLDRYVDAIILIAIISAGLCNPFLGSVALVGSFLVSYSRSRAEAAGIKMETIGFAERAERTIILIIGSLIATIHFSALDISMAFLGIIANLTVVQRALHVYSKLKQ
jgi:archaetidylinositol phosphate synthase